MNTGAASPGHEYMDMSGFNEFLNTLHDTLPPIIDRRATPPPPEIPHIRSQSLHTPTDIIGYVQLVQLPSITDQVDRPSV